MPALRRLLPALGVLAGLALAVLVGCAPAGVLLTDPDTATRDPGSGAVTEAGRIDVLALAVGDCLNDQDAEEVYDVPVVPCTEPHDYEVFHELVLDGDAWPGEEDVWATADEGCYAAFADFVGLAYEESALEFTSFTPTEASWEEGGDRIVSCLVTDPNGPTTGSLAGTAR